MIHFFRWTQEGQGMVEYALILALVALIVIVALLATGGQLINVYSNITATMCNYHVGCCANTPRSTAAFSGAPARRGGTSRDNRSLNLPHHAGTASKLWSVR